MSLRHAIQTGLHLLIRKVRPAPVGALLKRALRVRRVVVDTDQGKYWLDPVSNLGAAILTFGSYELGMQRTLREFLARGKIFIDLGANEGYFTIQGARLTEPEGRVVAVEPQDRLIPILQENVRLNNVRNVTVVHSAISDKKGFTKLHLAPDLNTGSTSSYRTTRYPVSTQMAKTITLADLLEDCGIARADLMKVDIEGAEYEAIFGSPEVFRDHRIKAIALELHNAVLTKRGKTTIQIESFLHEAGYRKSDRFSNSVWLAPDA